MPLILFLKRVTSTAETVLIGVKAFENGEKGDERLG